MRVLAALTALFLATLSCNRPSSAPQGGTGGLQVLFIGSSYLYTQDIPAIVKALADSAGDTVRVQMIAGADMALVDHWRTDGVRAAIANGGWDWVVLQQGPSSVEVNRDSLRLLVAMFAAEITRAGARTALFSAWPAEDRRQDFARAIESYRLAADDVGGRLLPVASAWLAAWDRSPSLALYADGLHPSTEGAYLSAVVVYSGLRDRSPLAMPAAVARALGLAPATASLLQQAADAVR